MLRRAAAVLALVLAAACGNQKSGLTLSTRIATPATAGALTVAGRVDVQRVRMVVRDLKLVRDTGATEVEVETGPYLLDLAGAELDGGVVEQFTADAPAGAYDELRFVVHKLEDGQTIGDPAIDASRSSVVLDLVVDGEPVTWRTDVNDEQRLFGSFTVGAEGGDNLTLSIDPSGWFTGPSGEFLDPRLSSNQQAIEENLRTSIDAFDDDDRDGHDDDGPNHT